ncbi:MAG: hypothetical protein O3B40_07185 [Actinobacteria bacterium]|nr:hypothetical protein [Actinomycetota bacterium]MDA2961705.1 hypothetical protein [Actinomycetota bacterium]MDA2994959.1 hypothetical protein [Actinomycetota bacterium]
MSAALLAISWEPELRGVLTVILGTVAFMGSVYMILGTNIGARLGFLVTLCGLAGWMALMGGIWWIYGIGLKGADPSWVQVPGRTVIQDASDLYQAGVLENRLALTDVDVPADINDVVYDGFVSEEWRVLGESEPAFGQAAASATVFLEEEDALEPGSFKVTNVFENGGEAYPKIFGQDALDQVAFFHKPYYTVVEVSPYIPLRTEPGRAPSAPEVDPTQEAQYVYMLRDLGSRREPAALITIGSTIVFLALAWMLHRRDRFVAENLARKAELPVG